MPLGIETTRLENAENRQDLFGHKSGKITTHNSAAELTNFIAARRGGVRRTRPATSRNDLAQEKDGVASAS